MKKYECVIINNINYIKNKKYVILDRKALKKIKSFSNTYFLIKDANNIKEIVKLIYKNKDKFERDITFFYIENDMFSSGQFIECLKLIFENNDSERNKYIYEKACDELDKKFSENNYCDFIDNKCILQRLNKSVHKNMGCCYKFGYSKFSNLPVDKGLCNHFNMKYKKCDIKCLTCKMFTCKYLKKNGIKFLVQDNWLIDIFFDKKQKDIIRKSFFESEEEILKRIMLIGEDKSLERNTLKI